MQTKELKENDIKLTIKTLSLPNTRAVKKCVYFKISLVHITEVSSQKQVTANLITFNESFIFRNLSIHSQLFAVFKVSLYQKKKKFIGQAELRLSCLLGITGINSIYELYDLQGNNIGYVDMCIEYKRLEAQKYLSLFSEYLFSSKFIDIPLNNNIVLVEEDEDESLVNDCYLLKDKHPILDSSITKLLIRKETNNVMRAMKTLLNPYNMSNRIFFSSLAKLEMFYGKVNLPLNTKKDGLETKFTDLGLLEKAKHYYRFTLAAYGWKGFRFFGTSSLKSTEECKTSMEFVSLPSDFLIKYQELVSKPSYFIALDRFTDCLVLVIRGTVSINDALTDLVCDYVPFLTGLGHVGIINTAYWFYNNVYIELLEWFARYKPRNIIFCGHSLVQGGAVAAALAMIIEVTHPEEINKIQCYSYASPPFVSLNLCRKYDYLIHNFTLEDDGVCGLSFGHMADLTHMIVAASHDNNNSHGEQKCSWLNWLCKRNNERRQKVEYVLFDNIINCRERLKQPSNPKFKNVKLYIPGTIYYMYYADEQRKPFSSLYRITSRNNISTNNKDKSEEKGMKKVYIEVCEPEYFEECLIRRNMFLQHIPKIYDRAFDKACETLMVELASGSNGKGDDDDDVLLEE